MLNKFEQIHSTEFITRDINIKILKFKEIKIHILNIM